jgi:hypothetical protein
VNFCPEWETLYAADRHMSIWPWSDLVALVMRHVPPPADASRFRVLELGVGAGANIPFFKALGVEFWGMDGSKTAIGGLKVAHPDLAGRLVVGDFTKEWPVRGPFDLIVDRASITHNRGLDIERTLAKIRAHLSTKGRLVAVDLFSTAFDEFKSGEPTDDPYTRRNFTKGRLAGTGVAHFADEARLQTLFAGFEIEHLEHKTLRRHRPQPEAQFASWMLVARPLPV